jgi:hypothetical protein
MSKVLSPRSLSEGPGRDTRAISSAITTRVRGDGRSFAEREAGVLRVSVLMRGGRGVGGVWGGLWGGLGGCCGGIQMCCRGGAGEDVGMFEFPTLRRLQDYCADFPDATVLYVRARRSKTLAFSPPVSRSGVLLDHERMYINASHSWCHCLLRAWSPVEIRYSGRTTVSTSPMPRSSMCVEYCRSPLLMHIQ